MRQHKTALVLRLAALAISIPLVPAARAADDLAVAELTVAEQTIAVEEAIVREETAAEEAIVREETAAAVDTIAEEEKLHWRESGSAAAALIPPLVCWTSAELDELAISDQAFAVLPSAETIIGIASFYDEPQQTASGEPFDPNAFTAAAQLGIRDKFGGIHFGVKYQPAYAVAEYGNKKLILKFNDVGPLRPGRKFDLSRAAMAYFKGLKKGLLPNFKVTPLPLGQTYRAGPVTEAQLAALGIGN
ncbi:MAG: rare lipoprotein, partial [Alphaproteobacteria bacterium]|nr:rare lipoprotein [Alphaproteobacteria bacterium]